MRELVEVTYGGEKFHGPYSVLVIRLCSSSSPQGPALRLLCPCKSCTCPPVYHLVSDDTCCVTARQGTGSFTVLWEFTSPEQVPPAGPVQEHTCHSSSL